MEINISNVNIQAENTNKENLSNDNLTNRIDPKNKNLKKSMNISLLTTKTDEAIEKYTYSDKKVYTYNNISSNVNDDSLLENLKCKGILNKSLEIKFDEYKNNLKKKNCKETSFSKISLIHELSIINKNLFISNIEQENLIHLKNLKEKKIDLLENSINNINEKIKDLRLKIAYNNYSENNKINNNFINNNNKEEVFNKKNNVNKNLKNILSQHYEIFSYDVVANLNNLREYKDPSKLEKVILINFLF